MESDSIYNNTPMETSPLVEVDATNNPPMEASPLVGEGLAKAHKAVSALRPHRREELFLAGTGAPRTEGAVNGHMSHAILDGGAYSNLITVKFLESLPDVTIAPSDVTFIMADGSKKFCLGVAKGLKLWIGGTEIDLDAAIFNHHKYTLLMGRQTMTKLGITTQYTGNNWMIEYKNLKIQLYVTFDTPQITEFLCEPIEANISKNKWLSDDQKSQLVEVIEPYDSNIVGDSDDLQEASGFEHKIDTRTRTLSHPGSINYHNLKKNVLKRKLTDF
ncbi:hypothetical protein DSO57_1033636 [Entomophthora muscae]|uniref:Uncharacterized protein n=1 Tax=Entomophthora muscae TaxID=34485 RepID=A0ACC2U9J2_9FUNG|nr:hypothetical protein DSO57_1033636 [Entomophthora muscae]